MKKIKHETITEAQHAVMEEINMLGKDEMSYDNTYAYTSAAFATLMIRPLMIKHGISKTKIKSENKGRWQNGIGVDIHAVYRYMLVGTTELIEGVNYIDVQVDGAGKAGKSGDKSMYASATTAGKYADLDFFYLPMVEDVESFNEIAELLDDEYSGESTTVEDKSPEPETESKPKKSSRLKKTAKKKEPEPDEQEEDEEISANSSDYTYDDVFDLIDALYEESGIEAVLEFTEGDDRVKLSNYVDELQEQVDDDEPEEDEDEEYEEEPEAEEEEAEESDEEGTDLNALDYTDPDVKAAIRDQIDLDDDETIKACFQSFSDHNQLTAFYTLLLEFAQEESAEFADSFNEHHFDDLQELFEELADE